MRTSIAAAFLVVIGCLQIVGDLAHWPALRVIAAALHASPAPKVFTAQEGFETYSSRFFLEWQDGQGTTQTFEVTPEAYRGVGGPYNRRNAYGAALSYGPVLVRHSHTRAMLEAVSRYALCEPGSLLEELGTTDARQSTTITIRLDVRDPQIRENWKLVFPINCGRRAVVPAS